VRREKKGKFNPALGKKGTALSNAADLEKRRQTRARKEKRVKKSRYVTKALRSKHGGDAEKERL